MQNPPRNDSRDIASNGKLDFFSKFHDIKNRAHCLVNFSFKSDKKLKYVRTYGFLNLKIFNFLIVKKLVVMTLFMRRFEHRISLSLFLN